MSTPALRLKIWLVDPINYSGMAYYDAGLAGGLADAGATVTLVGSDRPLVSPSPRGGLHVEPAFLGTSHGRPRWRRGLAYAHSIVRLTQTATRLHPDWLLWNYLEQPTLDRWAIRRAHGSGIRVGFVAHETEPWENGASRRGAYRWLIEDAADVVLIHGETNAQALRDAWDIGDDRIVVIEHGDYREWVDPKVTRRDARARLDLPLDAPIALFFGTLRMSKGLDTLLQAWPAVKMAVPAAELVIAGRPYRGTGLPAYQGLSDGILLRAGTISPADANDYYAACDVVAIPYDKVSTSGVMRYAYSAGRPVVATDIGELRTHVIDGHTGWLVPPGDKVAIARALSEALIDRERLADMGSRAKAYADREFDWRSIAAKLIDQLSALTQMAAQ